MEIKRIRDILGRPFTIRDLCEGYIPNSDDGSTTDKIFGYGGKLNIRPAFQRNNVYSDAQRNAVIETVLEECPLNTMYWVDKEDGTYECLDGQQRTLAICKYIAGEFSVECSKFPHGLAQDFPNLQTNIKNIAEQILDYELDIYICKGTPSEKMTWFKRINTAGEPLNDQEIRNYSYTGKWLSDAKARFSSAKGRGVKLADENPENKRKEPLLSGSWNRQGYLETALKWASKAEGTDIEEYMLKHRGDDNAADLWRYFSTILEWVRSKFVTYNSALRGMDWGTIYEDFMAGKYAGNIIEKSGADIQEEIIKLNSDDEVTASMKGIYQYIIYGDVKYLSIRLFDEKTAREVYEEQHHMCPFCKADGNNKEYAFKEMEADHIIPWSKGGKTEKDNCQMLCQKHNRQKSGK